MTSSYNSYPKIFALGHRALKHLFDNPVLIEEKIDGSQFSFAKINGELRCRSKGKEQVPDCPDKMFERACEVAMKLLPLLTEGYTYRAEYLSKPKHNVLAYDRTPLNNLILFDVAVGHETYMSYEDKYREALRLGLDTVPRIYEGMVTNPEQLKELLDRTSVLGGQKIEGLVIKNYEQFGPDKKILVGKFVSEAFKEVHKREWKASNPGKNEVISILAGQYTSIARWNKAVQHLRERGELTQSPKDIGPLMKEIQKDFVEECSDEIKDALFKWAAPKLQRMVIKGFAQYYKEKLMEAQFEASDGAPSGSARERKNDASENPSIVRGTD